MVTRPAVLALAAFALAATTLAAPSVPGVDRAGEAVASSTATPSCGPALRKPGGGTWTCTFADEFDGTAVDGSRWQVIESRTSGFHSGSECMVDSRRTVAVSRGTLKLTAHEVPPFTCRVSNSRGWASRYHGGMVTTLEHFAQTYGRFEFRARFPTSTRRGLQSAIWLYPEDTAYGRWPRSGEIDVAEFYTRYPDRVIPVVHYAGSRMDPDHTNRECLVERPGDFHTYVVEWGRDVIRISIDGVPCVVDDWAPWGMQKPAPFNRPFHISLTQALGRGVNSPVFWGAGRTAPRGTMEIDHVRVWK